MSENPIVDLRSDTVTQPSEAMREAMAHAAVGDDVFSEDPTVNELQRRCAELTGHDAGLFLPTGSMGNEVALDAHTQPGDEVVCDAHAHIHDYELGAMTAYVGAMPRAVPTEAGFFRVEDIEAKVKPHTPVGTGTGLIALENTHNMRGGAVYPLDVARDVIEFAHSKDIPVHLDGARAWNAAAASDVPLSEITGPFDSAMLSFSKGLGAPVGSILVGSQAFIDRARYIRKRMGGGMRQVGVLAGACLHALDHHLDRLTDDHANAERLADALDAFDEVTPIPPETNILIFELSDQRAADFCHELKGHDVLALPISARKVRMVTHLDVPDDKIDRAIEAIRTVLS